MKRRFIPIGKGTINRLYNILLVCSVCIFYNMNQCYLLLAICEQCIVLLHVF